MFMPKPWRRSMCCARLSVRSIDGAVASVLAASASDRPSGVSLQISLGEAICSGLCSLKRFAADDIRRLMRAIHERRPDLSGRPLA